MDTDLIEPLAESQNHRCATCYCDLRDLPEQFIKDRTVYRDDIIGCHNSVVVCIYCFGYAQNMTRRLTGLFSLYQRRNIHPENWEIIRNILTTKYTLHELGSICLTLFKLYHTYMFTPPEHVRKILQNRTLSTLTRSKIGRGKRSKYLRHHLRSIQNGQCFYCEKPMIFLREMHDDPSYATFEHLHEKSQGGSNRLDNLVLAHKDCNEQRSRLYMTPDEFKKYIMASEE